MSVVTPSIALGGLAVTRLTSSASGSPPRASSAWVRSLPGLEDRPVVRGHFEVEGRESGPITVIDAAALVERLARIGFR